MVSDRPGRLWLASRTFEGYLAYTVGTNNLTQWQPVRTVPGTHRGGVCTSRCYEWVSGAAISSWGPGRLELFILAQRSDGAIALMHTWGDNGQWSGRTLNPAPQTRPGMLLGIALALRSYCTTKDPAILAKLPTQLTALERRLKHGDTP